jgi:hypothetical protein
MEAAHIILLLNTNQNQVQCIGEKLLNICAYKKKLMGDIWMYFSGKVVY